MQRNVVREQLSHVHELQRMDAFYHLRGYRWETGRQCNAAINVMPHPPQWEVGGGDVGI